MDMMMINTMTFIEFFFTQRKLVNSMKKEES